MKVVLKIISALLFLLIGCSAYAQSDLNSYKYIIVPKRFKIFKNENEHQTSTLVKHLFTKNGFTAVYDDAFPDDLKLNRCLGLMADLEEASSLFVTKITIVLEDCGGNEVFRTIQGVTKEKEFKVAYNKAIREAMQSFMGVDYAYSGKSESKGSPLTISFKNDIKKLGEPQMDKSTNGDDKIEEVKSKGDTAVTQVATRSTQYYKDVTPKASDIKKKTSEKSAVQKTENAMVGKTDVWYAQATENGYQLVDSTPKIVMTLFKTSLDTIFIAKTDGKNGIVFKKDGVWIYEFYEDNQLVQHALHLKF